MKTRGPSSRRLSSAAVIHSAQKAPAGSIFTRCTRGTFASMTASHKRRAAATAAPYCGQGSWG